MCFWCTLSNYSVDVAETDSNNVAMECDRLEKEDKTDGANDDDRANKKNETEEKLDTPSAAVKHFKNMCTEFSRENVNLHKTVRSLQVERHTISLKVCSFEYLILQQLFHKFCLINVNRVFIAARSTRYVKCERD